MGPIIIFDKSVLQSLNPDEAMWLDQFYTSNITPLFYIETLADLEKEVGRGKTPEDVVGNLAYKTPDMHSRVNSYHSSLLAGELFGYGGVDIETGRPHLSGGREVELDGKTGIIFEKGAEEEALSRWQRHDFLNLERLQAKAWRRNLSNINLQETYEHFQSFFAISKPKNLEAVKRLIDFYMNDPDQGAVLRFGLTLIGIPIETQEKIMTRWGACGKPRIQDFAPYFTYIFSVDFFFYVAISADLIGTGRSSHKIDLAYLYYLPFCMIFTSNDNLHANIVPFFLRDDQTYINGGELKQDLKKLDSHYDSLPDEIKKQGVSSFALFPPDNTSFLVSRLWDKHMSKDWRNHGSNQGPMVETDTSKEIMKNLNTFRENSTPVSGSKNLNTDNVEHVLIERSVRAKKGKWTRFPPEVINRRKNENGEWESI